MRISMRCAGRMRTSAGRGSSLAGRRPTITARRSFAGEGSSFAADIGCRLSSDHIYDVNCRAIHREAHGERISSHLRCSRTEADKLLRGTIDFETAAPAVGNERGGSAPLGEHRNRSVPVILCDEEDVDQQCRASIPAARTRIFYIIWNPAGSARTGRGAPRGGKARHRS